jgi:predicted amidophosphoribosyltransferase
MRLLSLAAPPLCIDCRAPAPPSHALCSACRRRLEYLDRAPVRLQDLRVWAPVAYEGPARALVRQLKFHGAVALADQMAAAIAANAPAGMLAGPLVPVPSPPVRRRWRGFCHAELLARALAQRTGLPLLGVLERAGETRQVGRARADRLRAPPRFRAVRRGAAAVLLVDDVVTTGATLGACARALRAQGWRCGRAVAYARTPVR